VHKGPYDDIDTTYETVTTYLDAKDILAKDAFIEEYLNDVADPADAALEINIFVQPR
jgi:effector-binding domain-containing protein